MKHEIEQLNQIIVQLRQARKAAPVVSHQQQDGAEIVELQRSRDLLLQEFAKLKTNLEESLEQNVNYSKQIAQLAAVSDEKSARVLLLERDGAAFKDIEKRYTESQQALQVRTSELSEELIKISTELDSANQRIIQTEEESRQLKEMLDAKQQSGSDAADPDIIVQLNAQVVCLGDQLAAAQKEINERTERATSSPSIYFPDLSGELKSSLAQISK